MHSDAFTKSTKIDHICNYILFIISYIICILSNLNLWHASEGVMFCIIDLIKSESYYCPSKKLRQAEVWLDDRHCNAFWKHASNDGSES